MGIWIAVAAALGASTCSATASALQHRTAVRVPGEGGALATTRATLTHLPWLFAAGLQGLSFLLHAVALRFGQLTVVQPLLVCAVLLALPLNRLLRHERITARELGWALLLVIGLAGFLVAGTPPTRPPAQPADTGPAVGFGAAGLVVVAVCTVVTLRSSRTVGAAALGVAAAVLFACQAALLKACVGLVGAGPGLGALPGAWQPYVLVVVGLTAVVFTQLAYRRGPLSASLPLIMAVNPVLGVLIGSVVYDETVRDSTLALAVEIVLLTVLAVATLALTRLEQDRPATDPADPTRAAHGVADVARGPDR